MNRIAEPSAKREWKGTLVYFIRSGLKFMKSTFSLWLFVWQLMAQTPEKEFQYPHPIVITASRVKSGLVGSTREYTVMDSSEIDKLPVQSIPGVLRWVGGVDLRARGMPGVQSDFGLRGSSFEQVLVLVDGIRMNDPQTGHHNSDLPLTLQDIERIEVLYGPASSLYGTNGFGGVIHIVPRPIDQTKGSIEIQGGSFGTTSLRGSFQFKEGIYGGRLSVERSESKGYREDTDYAITAVHHRSEFLWKKKALVWQTGWIDKAFGANGFYANYPSWEHTKAFLNAVRLGWQIRPTLSFEAKLFTKWHEDFYILDYRKPEWYQNTHRTATSGFEFYLNKRFSFGTEIVLGMASEQMRLQSSLLGRHFQSRNAIFVEGFQPIGTKNGIHTGVRIEAQSSWGTVVSPSFYWTYQLSQPLQWRMGFGKAFRAPSFTELYYRSPANQGNPSLKPEKGSCIETGLQYTPGGSRAFSTECTFFYRDEKDRIDWIAWEKGAPWQATNIGKAKVYGMTARAESQFLSTWAFHFSYTWLFHKEPERPYFSKYGIHTLKHHLVLTLYKNWPWNIEQGIFFSLRKRSFFKTIPLLDLRFSKRFRWVQLGLDFSNVLDQSYEDIPGVPMPGRSIFFHSMMYFHQLF